MTQSDRVEFLDAMRGLAIAMVIINHTGTLVGLSGLAGHIAGLMTHGVQLFFVVSAYTIFMTYTASVDRGSATPARDFFVRRMLRIVPVYWMGIVLYTVVYGLESRGWRGAPEPWHYWLHASLLNVWHPAVTSSVVPGGWSISAEVMFYLTVPLWFAVIKNLRHALIFAVVSVTLGPLVVSYFAGATEPAFAEYSARVMNSWWYRNPLSQLGVFGAGIVLYFAVQNGYHRKFTRPLPNVALLLLSAAFALAGERLKLPVPAPQSQHFFAIAFALFGLALAALPWGIIVNRAMIFIGRVSYSAYLVHFLVLKQLTLIFPGSASVGYFALIVAGGFLITIPLAYLSYLWIERPAMAFGKQLIQWLNRRAAPA